MKSEEYIVASLGTLRNAHSEILASPPLIATSVKIGICRPESPASPTFFCRMPNCGSATFEQVGPTMTSQSAEAIRRVTEMPSSAVQRSSKNSTTILPRVPSASLTPPALLISSAAASIAASLLTPNERTTPDFAPMPAILTVRSCADRHGGQAEREGSERGGDRESQGFHAFLLRGSAIFC